MKRKKSAPPPAKNPSKEPEFANNPLQAALTARLDKDKEAKAKALAKAPQAQPKQAAPPPLPLPPPPPPPEPTKPAAKTRSTRSTHTSTHTDTHTSQHPKQTTKIPKLPDRPLSAQELFEFALQQLPAELKPYDLKFGSGAESPKLPDIDDQANKKAQAAQAAHAAAASAHLTPAQREALREATRVRELKAAFEQEMRDTGVRRVEQSKLADLQSAAATAASVAAIAGRPLEPARRSLSQESHPAPDLLAQLHSDELAIPINFTFAQKRLLERAQRKDDPIPEVSLRGLTLAEAMPVLQNFLNEQRNAGHRTVRVITGKGKQSEGEPVLKGAVESYFLSVGAPFVTAFAPEVTRDGDFGAYAVQLKKVT